MAPIHFNQRGSGQGGGETVALSLGFSALRGLVQKALILNRLPNSQMSCSTKKPLTTCASKY